MKYCRSVGGALLLYYRWIVLNEITSVVKPVICRVLVTFFVTCMKTQNCGCEAEKERREDGEMAEM